MARPRDFLISEMILFCFQIGMMLIIAVLDSGIHRMLYSDEIMSGWSHIAGFVGLVGFWLSFIEWGWGPRWDEHRLRNSYLIRMWASLFSTALWAFLIYAIYFHADINKAIFPIVFGPICIFFHFWSALILRRECVILDPQKDTAKLEEAIERRHIQV